MTYKNYNQFGNVTSYYSPTSAVQVANTMFFIMNTCDANYITFTPPANFTEIIDVGLTYGRLEAAYLLMNDDKSLTTSEMAFTLAGGSSTYGTSMLLAFEPITNNPPRLTLTSPSNN